MLKVEIDRIQGRVVQIILMAFIMVISLQFHLRLRRILALPTGLHTAARCLNRREQMCRIGCCQVKDRKILFKISVIKFPLHRERIHGSRIPVQPKPTLALAPIILGIAASRRDQAIALSELAVETVPGLLA